MTFNKLILLLIFFIPFLSSCKNNTEKLNFAISLGESEWKVFKEKIIPGYEKKYNCSINAKQLDANNLVKILRVTGESGKESPVDVFAIDNMMLNSLIINNLVMEFGKAINYINAYKYNNIIPNLKKTGLFNEKTYFVPFRPNVQIVYYNIEKFREYNLKPPLNWNELLNTAKIFKEKTGTNRVLLKAFGGAPTATQLYEFILSAGGDPMDLSSSGTIAAFAYLQKLWKYTSVDSLKAKWDTSNNYIAKESVYIMQNWPFGYKIIKNNYKKNNIKVYSGFAGPKREAHVIGGDMLGIAKNINIKKQKKAIQFINYLQSRDIQLLLLNELNWPSIRNDIGEKDVTVSDKEVYAAVKQSLKNGVFRKNVSYWNEYMVLINEVFDLVVVKQKNINKIFKIYSKKLNGIKK